MPKNIHNVVTDVQEKVTADHFPVKGSVGETIDGWTIVEFTTPNQDMLRFEVHLEHQNSCVLQTRGFTTDQRDTIMEIFTNMMFD
jgi:dihydrodipicolinate reductase